MNSDSAPPRQINGYRYKLSERSPYFTRLLRSARRFNQVTIGLIFVDHPDHLKAIRREHLERAVHYYNHTQKKNGELAKMVLAVLSLNSDMGVGAIKTIMRNIEECPVDLLDYFERHKHFDKLKSEGLGQKSKDILYDILTEGLEQCRERMAASYQASVKRTAYAGVSSGSRRGQIGGSGLTGSALG